MAVKLRLRREGSKKNPHYRIVAADARSPRDGRFIEIVGDYHPTANPSVIRVDEERALYWLRNGAQPTEPVSSLLRISGVLERFQSGEAPSEAKAQPAGRRGRGAAEQSQVAGTPHAPQGSAAAPEDIGPAPEDATVQPVAETEAVRGDTGGSPGEGVERGASASEQTPTEAQSGQDRA